MQFPDMPFVGEPLLVGAFVLIVMAGAIVQSGLGMGFGMTAAPLLALIDPDLVPAPALMIGLVTSFIVAWREREAIVWEEVEFGTLGRAVGVAAGAFLLFQITDQRHFQLVFGIMVAVAVILSLGGWRIAFSRTSLVAMGAVSGLMGTITSVGAPPLALIYQDKKAVAARPTLSAFFGIGCGLSLVGLALTGWMGWHDVLLSALMLPPMFLGFGVAKLLKGRFDRRYRPALLVLAGMAALVLIARGLA